MKHLKTFEEHIPVEYIAPVEDHLSYKSEIKKKKKKKDANGHTDDMLEPVKVLPNKVKDIIMMKGKS